MKKTIPLLFLFLFSLVISSQPGWLQIADFPGTQRDDGVAFVVNNKAYCGTGLQVGWSITGDFHCLDLFTDTWTTISSMPAGQERQYASGFSDGTNGFVFGGEAGGIDLNTLLMYSPVTNSWTAKASKPGNGVRGASCFVINDIAYFVGGAYQSTGGLNEVWSYNITTDTWTQKNNLPLTCWRGSGASVSGVGYLLFGRELNGRFIKELYEYYPGTDSWSLKSNFPNAGRSYSALQVRYGQLLVFGGVDTLNTYYNELWTYTPGTNAWQQLASMPSPGRKGGMSFMGYLDHFYYTCGIDQGDVRLKQTWKALFPDGINEIEKKEELRLFPNPATGMINLKLPKSSLKNYEIVDVSGRVSLSGNLEENQQINVSQLNPGMYFLVCGAYSSKLIIQ